MTQENKIQTRLFVGLTLTPEIRMHLNHSPSWKEAQTLHSSPLKEVRHGEKEYIGTLLPNSHLPLNELRTAEKETLTQLQQFCPELDTSSLEPVIFPQVYLL